MSGPEGVAPPHERGGWQQTGGDPPRAAAHTPGQVAERLGVVRQRIARAGGDPGRITVVAVTKGFGPDAVSAATAAGVWDIGENYAQELAAKAATAPAGVRWHFLGPVQRNKVRRIAPHVSLWQALDRVSAAEEVARRRPGARVLVQVNVSGEAQKAGCAPEDAAGVVASLRRLDLDVAGLMAVGHEGPPEGARPGFRRLAELGRRLELRELSMGMSDDLEVAVEEGATMVRIGRSLFGPRPGTAGLRR